MPNGEKMIDSKTIAEKALQAIKLIEVVKDKNDMVIDHLSIHDQGAVVAIMNILLGNKLKQLEAMGAAQARAAAIVDAMPIPQDEHFRQ